MKKSLSVLLALIMILAVIPFGSISASAATTPVFTLKTNKTSVGAGDIITATVTVSANSKLSALTCDLTYDTTKFELVEGSETVGGLLSMEYVNCVNAGRIKYAGTTSADSSLSSAGTIFTVKFKAKATGTLKLSFIEVCVADGNQDIDVTTASSNASQKSVSVTVKSANYGLAIKTPSKTTIRCKDGIVLHATTTKAIPSNYSIKWSADNDKFKLTPSADGKSCTIISQNDGLSVITASICDANGTAIQSVSITMDSDAGLFQKIAGFFRSLFGSTTIYEN